RVSRSIRDIAYRALSIKEHVATTTGREPTIEEIAKELQVTKEEVSMALDAILDPVSLQEPVYHDGADAVFVMDQIKDEKNIDDSWLEKISLKEAIHRLSDREQNILKLRFFEGKTQMEVANEIGISQAQVSRLEKSALSHMKKNL
ncbi:MAG: sigma-70 family RNA polymerase sigma factor, partial [Clostridia bacterium]|nr:sigma-70 family RNA polymerase sigma factor [Clostridia bacterium]